MKAIQRFVGVGLCLFGLASGSAQAATCNAQVAKKSVKASTNLERAWDIQFDVNVTGCAKSSGTFEYLVDLTEKGTTEFQTASATFELESEGLTTITVTYLGKGFKDLKEVRGVKVTSCTCGS